VLDEQKIAQDQAAQAALGMAGAAVRLAEDEAALEDRTLSAKDAHKIQIDTLTTLANKIGGPVATQIMDMVGKLKTLDKTNADPDATLNDQASAPIGTVAQRVRGLNGMSATAYVYVNTDSAMARLANLSQRLSAVASTGRQVAATSGVIARFQEGGYVNAGKNQPVPAIVHGGEYVLSADVVDRIKNGDASRGAAGSLSLPGSGSASGSTVIQFNGTFLSSKAELGRMVDEALAESRRRGNRAA
jgi:hypothetical protein